MKIGAFLTFNFAVSTKIKQSESTVNDGTQNNHALFKTSMEILAVTFIH